MLYLIGLIIFLVLAGIVLQAVLPVVGYICMTAFLLAAAAGVVFFFVEFVSAAFTAFAGSAPIERLRVQPPPASDDGPDPVWRSYYAGAALSDYREAMDKASRRVITKVLTGEREPVNRPPLVRRIWDVLDHFESYWLKGLTFIPVVLATAGIIAGTFTGFFLGAITSIAFLLLLGVLVLGVLIASGTTRLVELSVLAVRGITIECQNCHDRALRPVYRCSTCSARHRRLVPGLSGVAHRTCQCLTPLPTLLAAGKAKLAAQCASCGTQLPVKGLTAPTFHIPVIAGPAAGKSIFMHCAISRLLVRGGDDEFEFADEQAKIQFRNTMKLGVLEDPRRITKTRNVRPRAYNVYVGKEKSTKRRLLYLYDPAGEISESADQLADSPFLQYTKGVVFVIDPFSLRAVRSATGRTLLRQVNASTSDVRSAAERFVETLRERAGKRSKRLELPVAVVITKADALRDEATVRHPYATLDQAATDPNLRAERDAAVRAWLKDIGSSGDLVSSLDSNFTATSYFVVSFEDAEEVTAHQTQQNTVTNDDPAAPLLWLLSRKVTR